MKRLSPQTGLLFLLIASFGLTAWAVPVQEEIYAELAGDYRLDVGDRTLPFRIILVEEKLLFNAQVPGQAAQTMIPVEGKELTFTSLDPNGNEITFVFVRDETKKITGCTVIVPARNSEATAVKVEIK